MRSAIALTTAFLILLSSVGPVAALGSCPSPPPGGLCVVPALFTDTDALGCLAQSPPCTEPTAEQKELLCGLAERPEYHAKGGECFTWNQATRAACPKEGRYLVWRSASADIWVLLDADTDSGRVHGAMKHLKRLLHKTFEGLPPTAYEDVQLTSSPLSFDGKQCLPRGFVLGRGSGDGDSERVTPGEFFDDARSFVRLEQETRSKLKTVCEKTPERCGEENSPDEASEQETAAKETKERISAEAQAYASDKGDTNKNGTEAPKAEVKGSGGFLPPGAPPWIADLFDMMLTYLGVKEVVQGAAMALFMLAPDLVYELAALSAGLTKDLANADLDKAFAEIKKLYQVYNTAQGLMNSIEDFAAAADFDSVGDLIKSTGKMIESLPKDLQTELRGIVGKDVTKAFGQLQGVTAALDPKMIEGVIDGSAKAAVVESIEQEIRDSLAEAVTGALANELGVDSALLGRTVSALAQGDFDGAREEALQAAAGEVGHRLGVPPGLISGVFDGTATEEDVAAFAVNRVEATIAEALGVGASGLSPDHLRQAITGNWQPLVRTITSQLFGEKAIWFDAPPVMRATELRRFLEASPIGAEGLSDEGLQACLDGDTTCFENLVVSLPSPDVTGARVAVASWEQLSRQAAVRLARALKPKIVDIVGRAEQTCGGLNARPITAPSPPSPEIRAEDLLRFFRGEIPDRFETLARALLCCPPGGGCDADHLAKVAKDMAQAQIFTLPAIRSSPELKNLFRDQGQSVEALLAPAIDRTFDTLASSTPVELDSSRPLIEVVDRVRADAARQPPRTPRAGPAAGATASSAAAVRLLATRRCVLVDDGRDGVFCSDSDRWDNHKTCRERLKQCRKAIEGEAR